MSQQPQKPVQTQKTVLTLKNDNITKNEQPTQPGAALYEVLARSGPIETT